jgi:DNA-binding transcriptional MocR family regulator
VREIAYQLSVTPGTVARAYSALVDAGLLEAVVGRGTFVARAARAEDSSLTGDAIEVDSVVHKSDADSYAVNMLSPHLPSRGQAGLVRQLMMEVAQDPPSGMMHYPSGAGTLAAREAVTDWLSQLPIGTLSPEDVILANGGQNAIMLVFQCLLKGRRPTILVEELAYPGFRRAAELLRADVVPVAMDADGIIPDAVEEAARTHGAQILCLCPEVHNPTCGHMPERRRHQIASVARRLDMEILEDDCYRVEGRQTPSLRMIAPERSWFVSSISKGLTPALRLGFVAAPPGRAAGLRRVVESSFFGVATPLADLCGKLLSHPDLPQISRLVREETNSYMRAAVNILGRYDLRWREDALFMWLPLPEGWRASAFCQAAEAQGVKIRSAEDYQTRSAAACHAVRIAVNAGVSLKSYEAAIQRLGQLLDNPPEQMGV